MTHKALVDTVARVIMARAPHEVTRIHRNKVEGRSKRPRIKVKYVEESEVRFRISEPGSCHDVCVRSKYPEKTVQAVRAYFKEYAGVTFEVLGPRGYA